jgi:3-hydroxyisobutyrate dehydrogenase-like beta-hydroxyacid dehydrogenase
MAETPYTVAVLGAGEMGSALARALLAARHTVRVWNRSPEKCEPLRRAGAAVAASPASAAEAADMVVVCVRDYEATHGLLKDQALSSALQGRVLIQLSTGTPGEARALGAWARERSIGYLDGAILAYPNAVGTESCVLLYAGPAQMFETAKPVLLSFGANPAYLGEDLGAASMMDAASLTVYYASLLGFLHGAAICEAEGWPLQAYVSGVVPLLDVLAQAMQASGEKFSSGDYSSEGLASIQTDAAALAHVVQTSQESAVDPALPKLLLNIFNKGVAAGHGGDYLAHLIKVFRK